MCGGKSLIAAVPGAGAVGGYDPEMVGGARAQSADVGTDVSECVPSLTVGSSGEAVAERRAILEINRGGQPMRIKPAIERG